MYHGHRGQSPEVEQVQKCHVTKTCLIRGKYGIYTVYIRYILQSRIDIGTRMLGNMEHNPDSRVAVCFSYPGLVQHTND